VNVGIAIAESKKSPHRYEVTLFSKTAAVRSLTTTSGKSLLYAWR